MPKKIKDALLDQPDTPVLLSKVTSIDVLPSKNQALCELKQYFGFYKIT